MKTVLLLNSPLFVEQSDINRDDYLPPIGLGIVASALEKTDQVIFLDLIVENYSVAMVLEKINVVRPDFICINIFTTNYTIVKSIVEGDKAAHQWIIGGLSTKAFYQDIFSWNTSNHIDIVCGDGEKIVIDIVGGTVSEEPINKIEKRRYYLVNKSSSYYVQDLNDEYLNRAYFKNEPYLNVYHKPEVSIYASRGCPHNCAFCGAAHSHNQEMGIRRKSSVRIIQELEDLKKIHGNISCIRVLDDLFLLDKDSMLNAALVFRRFEYEWRAMCHIKSLANVDLSTLKELKESGCKELFIGIESGSQRILKKLHKTDDTAIIVEAVSKLFYAGIDVKAYFVCGIPTETEADLKLTMKLATELKSLSVLRSANFRITCFQFRPYCGTDLYDEIIDKTQADKHSILYNTTESKEQKGKKIFSFDSGNYSEVTDEVLSEFISEMNEMR